jgi:hypothetical protein
MQKIHVFVGKSLGSDHLEDREGDMGIIFKWEIGFKDVD